MEPLGTILFLLLAVVVSGKVARLTRAPLPLVQIGLGVAVALSVALFVPAWPPGREGAGPVRIWIAETCIAALASLVGLIR